MRFDMNGNTYILSCEYDELDNVFYIVAACGLTEVHRGEGATYSKAMDDLVDAILAYNKRRIE